MDVPLLLLLLLLLLLDGRPGTNERLRLLRIHHVRMDRLEIALGSVHLHRLLLDLLVLDGVGGVRVLEMLLLLLLLWMLHLSRMQVEVLLVDVMLLLVLLLHVMRMDGGRRRKGDGRAARQDVGFELLKVRVREKRFLRR